MTQDLTVRLTVAESADAIRLHGTFETTSRRALAGMSPRALEHVLASIRRQVLQAHANATREANQVPAQR